MLDVEYLIAPPPLTGAMIYLYRTGVLQAKIKSILRRLAAGKNQKLVTCSDNDEFRQALGGGSFFPHCGPYCCVWVEEDDRTPGCRARQDAMLALFASDARVPKETLFVLFVGADSQLTKRNSWATAEAAAFVLREPCITRETLKPALRGLQASTDLAACPNWLDQPGFVACFDGFWERRDPSLRALLYAFEDRILTCIDPCTEVFEPPEAASEAPAQVRSTSPLRCLRRLLAEPDGWALVDLITAIDERQNARAWSPREIIVELHRIAGDVLASPERTTRRAGSAARRVARPKPADAMSAAVLWAALVLAWDGHLAACVRAGSIGDRRTPSHLIPTLDRLGRDFLRRSAMPSGNDLLVGHWRALERVFAKRSKKRPGDDQLVEHRGASERAFALNNAAAEDLLAARREKTVRRLVECLNALTMLRSEPWSVRLRRLAAAALVDAQPCDADEVPERADAALILSSGNARL